MNIEEIQKNLEKIIKKISEESFIYDLLTAYGQPKATITRLKNGDYNLSKINGEVIWKKKLLFREVNDEDLHVLIDHLRKDPVALKHSPRFIILTDFSTLLTVDTKTNDTLDIPIKEISKHTDFFLPWAGMEKAQHQTENPADIKAAERMGRLYDIILLDNEEFNQSAEGKHALNIFLSRLLFCFFAEDAEIFSDGIFTNSIASHTVEDGSDLQSYLEKLFKVLDLKKRPDYPQYLQAFPYVNGGLFAENSPVPILSRQARKFIIEAGALDWSIINPDIFGSMMQAVVRHSDRGNLGMHYTSVENIMKVISPLFLDELYDDLEKAGDNERKLEKLLDRIYHLRIFDPACGSGNFLIISYKELCNLEIEIFERLQTINPSKWTVARSGVHLNQFYGIEIDDFAHEIAKLSLWLAEHQMNLEFKEVFGQTRPSLPLHDSGNIVSGNALRLDWEEVCPINEAVGTYVIGNPPYLGGKLQSKKQKDDLQYVANELGNCKNLDYIACWFIKATSYVSGSLSKFAFVSTNSICQGEQVALLWPYLLGKKVEICFAYQSFKWTNRAKGNAGIICVIVAMRNKSKQAKYLFVESIKRQVDNINPYLAPGEDLIVNKRSVALSDLPNIYFGSMPRDGGHLTISPEERESVILSSPESEKFFLKYTGSKEFIRGELRYCLWIRDEEVKEAVSIPEINEKLNAVKRSRLASDANSTKEYAKKPHRFVQLSYQEKPSIIIPSVSSERRDYIPIGFLGSDTVISNLAFAIYGPEPYIFAIISSLMHMTWVRTVAGRLKTDYRYSSGLCYNTFPFPELAEKQKTILESHVFNILDEREKYSEKTISELYDPDNMPIGLRQAHKNMDIAVEQCYRSKPFSTDEERLEYLFKLYEEMIEAEKEKTCLI